MIENVKETEQQGLKSHNVIVHNKFDVLNKDDQPVEVNNDVSSRVENVSNTNYDENIQKVHNLDEASKSTTMKKDGSPAKDTVVETTKLWCDRVEDGDDSSQDLGRQEATLLDKFIEYVHDSGGDDSSFVEGLENIVKEADEKANIGTYPGPHDRVSHNLELTVDDISNGEKKPKSNPVDNAEAIVMVMETITKEANISTKTHER
ncbi:hypothetical protein K7X08_030444 [Anisodus acutangulus]|uniref:Uncharacterized protein n=1 Tax=Anisodus acutangulus TaxID=402998 RepID=A0A9Q1L5P0_9SOLA|nr:hypothetical protein K7X08_030444 [Anisodus acutangulus]